MKRYEIDQDALQKAIEFLGLKQPVYIKFSGVRGSGEGSYCFLYFWESNKTEERFIEKWAEERELANPPSTFHKIVLKNYLNPKIASETIWHELCHAMQAERTSNGLTGINAVKAWRKADDQDCKYKYDERPWEIEARRYEKFAEWLPLCIPSWPLIREQKIAAAINDAIARS